MIEHRKTNQTALDQCQVHQSKHQKPTWLLWYEAQFYWCFFSSGTKSMEVWRTGLTKDQFRSVTQEDRANHKTKEHLLIAMLFFFTPSSPSHLPPPSTCLCVGLLLISEALSFVSVRRSKGWRMKRDTWRGDERRWLPCVTTHTHTHTRMYTTIVTTKSHRETTANETSLFFSSLKQVSFINKERSC